MENGKSNDGIVLNNATHDSFCLLKCLALQRRPQGRKVPEHFNKLLLEKRRNCEESEERRKALQCFATRTLPAVSASQTRVDKRKCSESLSDCFSHADEALGLLLVVNCERQWRS